MAVAEIADDKRRRPKIVGVSSIRAAKTYTGVVLPEKNTLRFTGHALPTAIRQGLVNKVSIQRGWLPTIALQDTHSGFIS